MANTAAIREGRMKLVVWTDSDDPWDGFIDEYGDIVFHDSPGAWNLEIGDQIQYHTELGVTCYIVVDVVPQSPFDGLNVLVKVRSLEL
jgi:hypothetical protein